MNDHRLDLNLVRLFATVVEAGSMTEAARRSGVTRSNVSRRLKELERHLGAQLMLRTTRHVELTESGSLLYRHALNVLKEMEAARASIDSLGSIVRGDVGVRVPTGLGHFYLSDVLIEFALAHPLVSVRALINDHIADLVSAEVDIALKITSAPPDDHVARLLCDVEWCLCASPRFLEQHAPVTDAGQLQDRPLIAPASLGRRFELRAGAEPSRGLVRVSPRLQSGDYPFLRQAMLAGIGIALLPRYAVWRDLDSGAAREVMPGLEPEGVGRGLYLLTPPNRYPTLAARALIEFLRQRIHEASRLWARR